MKKIVIAIALGATAAVVVGALGASLAGSLEGPAARSALDASRVLAAFAGLAIAAAYVVAAAGRRRAGLAFVGVVSAVVATWMAFVATRAPERADLVLLQSDRDGLEEVMLDGQRWVAHRTLGFRIPQPDVTLRPSPAIVRDTEAAAGPGWAQAHQLWAFESEDRGITVVLDLSRAEHVDRASLEELLEAVVGPLRAEASDVESSPIELHDGCASATFGAALPHGGRVDGRVLAFQDPRSHRAFRLAITIVGPAAARAGEFLESVVVPCD